MERDIYIYNIYIERERESAREREVYLSLALIAKPSGFIMSASRYSISISLLCEHAG